MELLGRFVAGNPTNQRLVWGRLLPGLMRLTGPLPAPAFPGGVPAAELAGPSKAWPAGFDAEAVVLACLRGNPALVQEGVPKEVRGGYMGFSDGGLP